MIWDLNIADEAITLLLSVLLGAVASFIYDIFRGIRRAGVANSGALVFFGDIFFFLLLAVLVFLFLIVRTDGTVRTYVFLGMAVGMELFILTLSRYTVICVAFIVGKTVMLKRLLFEFSGKASVKVIGILKNAEKSLKNKKKTKKTLETAT